MSTNLMLPQYHTAPPPLPNPFLQPHQIPDLSVDESAALTKEHVKCDCLLPIGASDSAALSTPLPPISPPSPPCRTRCA